MCCCGESDYRGGGGAASACMFCDFVSVFLSVLFCFHTRSGARAMLRICMHVCETHSSSKQWCQCVSVWSAAPLPPLPSPASHYNPIDSSLKLLAKNTA